MGILLLVHKILILALVVINQDYFVM
ncbi:hypothetical protein NC652_020096 [Populus alba x Populus x berolinensis]|nr:hypothetical protein NC652_020096 [Populus alba x Populus x berolinensis]